MCARRARQREDVRTAGEGRGRVHARACTRHALTLTHHACGHMRLHADVLAFDFLATSSTCASAEDCPWLLTVTCGCTSHLLAKPYLHSCMLPGD
eukprot:scaffold4216_cov145-Isochrysis_galbana.AAC.4